MQGKDAGPCDSLNSPRCHGTSTVSINPYNFTMDGWSIVRMSCTSLRTLAFYCSSLVRTTWCVVRFRFTCLSLWEFQFSHRLDSNNVLCLEVECLVDIREGAAVVAMKKIGTYSQPSYAVRASMTQEPVTSTYSPSFASSWYRSKPRSEGSRSRVCSGDVFGDSSCRVAGDVGDVGMCGLLLPRRSKLLSWSNIEREREREREREYNVWRAGNTCWWSVIKRIIIITGKKLCSAKGKERKETRGKCEELSKVRFKAQHHAASGVIHLRKGSWPSLKEQEETSFWGWGRDLKKYTSHNSLPTTCPRHAKGLLSGSMQAETYVNIHHRREDSSKIINQSKISNIRNYIQKRSGRYRERE